MIKLCSTYVWPQGVKCFYFLPTSLVKIFLKYTALIENMAFMEFDSLYINTLTKEGLIFDFVGEKSLYCRCLAVVLMI